MGGATAICCEQPVPERVLAGLMRWQPAAEARALSRHWIDVPQRSNRLVIFDGSLPHFVTPVSEAPDGNRITLLVNVWDELPAGYGLLNDCSRASPDEFRIYQKLDAAQLEALYGIAQTLEPAELATLRHEELGQDQVRVWAGVKVGEPLFEVLYVFDPGARAAPRAAASAIFGEEIESIPRSGYAVHLGVRPEPNLRLELTFDRSRVEMGHARAWLWRLERTLSTLATLATSGTGSVATVIGRLFDPLPNVETLGPDIVDGLDEDELDRLCALLDDEPASEA